MENYLKFCQWKMVYYFALLSFFVDLHLKHTRTQYTVYSIACVVDIVAVCFSITLVLARTTKSSFLFLSRAICLYSFLGRTDGRSATHLSSSLSLLRSPYHAMHSFLAAAAAASLIIMSEQSIFHCWLNNSFICVATVIHVPACGSLNVNEINWIMALNIALRLSHENPFNLLL